MRTLTVTATESSWTTYLVDVPDDFDETDTMALEDYMFLDGTTDTITLIEHAVEARDLTIEKDEPQ